MQNPTPEQSRLIGQVETMLALYKMKEDKQVQTAAINMEWNLKKLRGEGGESLSAEEWGKRTLQDLAVVARVVKEGESGGGFAASFPQRYKAAFPSRIPEPAAAAATHAQPAAASSANPAPVPVQAPPEAAASFDLARLLSDKTAQQKEKLDWRTAVVDLFKLMEMDSSLAGRRKTANAMGMDDEDVRSIGTPEGNEMLHAKLMGYLASHQGNLPMTVA